MVISGQSGRRSNSSKRRLVKKSATSDDLRGGQFVLDEGWGLCAVEPAATALAADVERDIV